MKLFNIFNALLIAILITLSSIAQTDIIDPDTRCNEIQCTPCKKYISSYLIHFILPLYLSIDGCGITKYGDQLSERRRCASVREWTEVRADVEGRGLPQPSVVE